MANYIDTSRSFLNGLSDFWLRYFKEIDWLDALYKGEEVLVGQGYVELMGLLLNNSVQDASLYTKEYFKQILISETDITYKQTTTASTARWVYVPRDTIVDVRTLNNKIFNPTVGLDKDVDFYIDANSSEFSFKYDPTNAYLSSVYGSLDAEFVLRTKLVKPDAALIRVWLNDTGSPLSISVSGYDVTITYDGPLNTATTTANAIVQAINLNPLAGGLLYAYVSGTGTGTLSPVGTPGLQALSRTEFGSLDGVGSRNVNTLFAGKLVASTVADWLLTNVEKGDILRLLNGATVGVPVDFKINLLRKDALYVNANGRTVVETADKQDFVILRRPEENTSIKEPLPISGVAVQSGVDGTVTAVTKQLSSPTAVFSPVHENELIEIVSPGNSGFFRIIEVINPNTVVFATSLAVDETPVTWSLYSVIDPTNISVDGAITNNGDGTATFTSASASFNAFEAPNSVIKLKRPLGITEAFTVQSYVDPQTLILKVVTVADGVGITWGWAKYKAPVATVAFSPPVAWIDNVDPVIIARRFVDNKAVEENVDYTFSKQTGIVTPITVWQASATNNITYDYLLAVFENQTPLQSGINGTLTSGTPNTFSSPTAAFDYTHVGCALNITGTPSASSDGIHFIKTVLSATSVELTDDRVVPTGVFPGLTWQLLTRGSFTNTATAEAYQSVYWSPNVLVDKFHLYLTFGYLIGGLTRSTETYRQFIRGLFQLFMLGPTLERFESALNVVAGVPVIRDDGELLLSYDNGSEASGVDGVLTAATNTFSAVSASFSVADLNKYIYISTGFNQNKLFKILTVVNATTVSLDQTPTSDSPVSWELTSTETQTVTTSRTTYTFDRRVPLRAAVTLPANFGLKTFKAFEVISDLFNVTDYVENDSWWEFVQIPEELMPNQDSLRRQSSPTLYENVINPADAGCIGDPGFYIGADSDGITPTASTLRTGVADGTWVPDPLYPFSNNVYFDTPTGAFTSSDIGNYLVIASPPGRYLIETRVSSTRVKVQAFLDLPAASGLTWRIETGTLPKRNKAAFVILDKVLKYHLFQVEFDSTLLDVLRANIIDDLNELVFAAKPSYTYLVVTPAALFQERIKIEETFYQDTVVYPGGSAGSSILANTNPLLVLGSSWLIGTWFRNASSVSTFSAPTPAVSNALGATPPGYRYYLNKAYIDPAQFVESGNPLQVSELVQMPVGVLVPSSDIVNVTASVSTITSSIDIFQDYDVMSYVVVAGSGLGQDGTYRITKFIDTKNVEVYTPTPLTSETGVSVQLSVTGTLTGHLQKTATGEVTFTDLMSRATFTAGNVGNYIRLPYVNYLSNQGLRINSVTSSTQVKIAEDRRVHPIVGLPDVVVNVSLVGDVLTVASPGDLIFSKSMCRTDREALDYATSAQERYYVVFTSGPNAGMRYYIKTYISASSVVLQSSPVPGTGFTCYLGVVKSPDIQSEVAFWELTKEQIYIDGDTIQLPAPARQDPQPAVGYTAYGVLEPVDPTLSVLNPSAGDTPYAIGMVDPRQHRGKSRTGRDTDLREDPIMITRTP